MRNAASCLNALHPIRWTLPGCAQAGRIDNGGPIDTLPKAEEPPATPERLAYSVQEAADLLGVNYFSVHRLTQCGQLKVCRPSRGKRLVRRSDLLELLEQ